LLPHLANEENTQKDKKDKKTATGVECGVWSVGCGVWGVEDKKTFID